MNYKNKLFSTEKEKMEYLSSEILDACITVHKEMGPGLLESVYEFCLMKEFELRGIPARNQVLLPLIYKGFSVGKELKIDILVDELIIMENKSCEKMIPVYQAQIISYLKLTKLKLGFLVNFNVPILKEGFKRFVNNY
ncbi:MAG: GTP-binding signal recognition particle [Chlorobi bacterium OLB5]|nr:MAG: GTP-binding signal recognition particle [Chlorobi bacterium OLB5]